MSTPAPISWILWIIFILVIIIVVIVVFKLLLGVLYVYVYTAPIENFQLPLFTSALSLTFN